MLSPYFFFMKSQSLILLGALSTIFNLHQQQSTKKKKKQWNLQISWTNINLHIFFQILKDVTIKLYKKPIKFPSFCRSEAPHPLSDVEQATPPRSISDTAGASAKICRDAMVSRGYPLRKWWNYVKLAMWLISMCINYVKTSYKVNDELNYHSCVPS